MANGSGVRGRGLGHGGDPFVPIVEASCIGVVAAGNPATTLIGCQVFPLIICAERKKDASCLGRVGGIGFWAAGRLRYAGLEGSCPKSNLSEKNRSFR